MIATPGYLLFDGRKYSKVIAVRRLEKGRAPGIAGRSLCAVDGAGLVLIDVGLDIAGIDDGERAIQDNVAWVGGLEDLEHGSVARTGLAVIDEFELNCVAVYVVESTGTHGNDGVDWSRGWIGFLYQRADSGKEGCHMEVMAAALSGVGPVDLEVVRGLVEVAIDFKAFRDDDIGKCHLFAAASEAAGAGCTVGWNGESEWGVHVVLAVLTSWRAITPCADGDRFHIDGVCTLW